MTKFSLGLRCGVFKFCLRYDVTSRLPPTVSPSSRVGEIAEARNTRSFQRKIFQMTRYVSRNNKPPSVPTVVAGRGTKELDSFILYDISTHTYDKVSCSLSSPTSNLSHLQEASKQIPVSHIEAQLIAEVIMDPRNERPYRSNLQISWGRTISRCTVRPIVDLGGKNCFLRIP